MDSITYDAKLRIPSNLIYIRSVRAFIKELAENLGFCAEKVQNIELATDEIISNAVEHGSEDSDSKISILCSSNDEEMIVTIRDQGRNNTEKRWSEVWANVISNEVYVGTERGHGLLLARLLSDDMNIETNSTGGLDVRLTWFNRGSSKYCINANRVCCMPQI